ncbi:hypothetical protein NDU88_005791 [Pleurodeles waltl]|uniref:Uncharacterized protein n=1 Tax=Pleurodeles waltl TaxID=8319 RepID=A0AAV7VMR6_PLEWA|nr:hypothetical protein NDU88_005791 [Pleurodeles waltl]
MVDTSHKLEAINLLIEVERGTFVVIRWVFHFDRVLPIPRTLPLVPSYYEVSFVYGNPYALPRASLQGQHHLYERRLVHSG